MAKRTSSYKHAVVALLLGLCVCVVVGGCATPQGGTGSTKAIEESMSVPTAELHQGADSAPAVMPPERVSRGGGAAPVYKIGPGDLLGFRCFDDESLSSQVKVRYDGHISLPLIDDLKVGGLTRDDATKAVTTAYGEIFLDPKLSLSILEANSKTYATMGNLARPGEYPYDRPMTLLSAINKSGGMRVNQRSGDSYVGAQGQLTAAIVIRHTEGEREVIKYDLSDLGDPGPHPSDASVYPGDVIYVPEGVNLVYVLGEVARPSVFELREGMTLLQLLVQAGGAAETRGSLSRVVLMRETDGDSTNVQMVNVREILKTGQDITMQPGDIVYVPRKHLVRLSEFVNQFTSSISPVLSLYTQAYEAWYTKDRYDQLFDLDTVNSGTQNLLVLEQFFRDVGRATGTLP